MESGGTGDAAKQGFCLAAYFFANCLAPEFVGQIRPVRRAGGGPVDPPSGHCRCLTGQKAVAQTSLQLLRSSSVDGTRLPESLGSVIALLCMRKLSSRATCPNGNSLIRASFRSRRGRVPCGCDRRSTQEVGRERSGKRPRSAFWSVSVHHTV